MPTLKSLSSLLTRCLLPLALCSAPILSACSVDGPNGEAVDTNEDALNSTVGCDYSFARPSIPGLHAQGYRFASRYLSYDPSKNISKNEAKALIAAGIDVVLNWESFETSSLNGYNQGVSDAKEADKLAKAAGAPADRPIYFSVDFDATPGEQGAINSYMDGVASVIGRSRTGAYGGYYVIKRLFDAGKIKWGWQAFAWSGGQWDPRAQVRQVQNGLDGGQIDKDIALVADYGQWGVTKGGGGGEPPPPDTCKVHADGKLYCGNKNNSDLYSETNTNSNVVDHLQTTTSWFKCWSTGALHAGGNRTWYYTEGDENAKWGWVPAVDLDTTNAFDANPTAQGLKECAAPLPALPSDCDIHGDGKLYCKNKSGSAMYSSDNGHGMVVNHLESSTSWFTCWSTGALHAGGNHTWYYTEGDLNSKWGWVPAVDLSTPNTFDADPGAYGFKKCN